jgi:aspartyl protease family protein
MRLLLKSPAAVLLAIMLCTFPIDHHTTLAQPKLTGNTAPILNESPPQRAAKTIIHRIAADEMGNFVVSVTIAGHEVRMLVDTGATFVSLTSEDAESIGFHLEPADYKLKVNSADGMTTVAQIHLPCVRVGAVEVNDVDGIVMAPGAASGSLLGMSFLRRLGSFGVAGGQMTFEQ